MKKKHLAHRKHRTAARTPKVAKQNDTYMVVVRSWMLLVMFALMLGMGAIAGTALNQQSSEPVVAGASTSR